MNWILLILGIPCGVILCLLGEKLVKRAKVKNDNLRGLLMGTPMLVLVLLVIIVDNL